MFLQIVGLSPNYMAQQPEDALTAMRASQPHNMRDFPPDTIITHQNHLTYFTAKRQLLDCT
jgi:hypothetical protein